MLFRSVDLDDAGCTSELDEDEGGFEKKGQCSNGLDDDGDGYVDGTDADCASNKDDLEASNCTDAHDNDGDGWTDADDPDCAVLGVENGTWTPGCNDGADNDGDGDVDAADIGCVDGFDTVENDPVAACSDNKDNDLDGWTDTSDPDCIDGTAEAGGTDRKSTRLNSSHRT